MTFDVRSGIPAVTRPARYRQQVYATISAALLLALGLGLGARTASWVAPLERTSGVVESLHPTKLGDALHPVTVAFADGNGRRHRALALVAPTLAAGLRPTEPVDVWFDPADPVKSAHVSSEWRLWMWPSLCLIAGLVLLAFREPEQVPESVPEPMSDAA